MAGKKRNGVKNGAKKAKGGTEYRFRIDAYTPLTMPMARLAEYLTELAEVLGQPSSVHFVKVIPGSTVPVIRIDREAVPKVRDRTDAVRRGEGPSEAVQAFRKINKYLREDDATAVLQPKGQKTAILKFPGREESAERFAAVRQHGSIDGMVRRVGGIDETISITLKSEGQVVSHIHTSEATGKRLGNHLFEPVRLHGQGKWRRDSEGVWILEEFRVVDFEPIAATTLSKALDKIRAIPTEWTDDTYTELGELRNGSGGEHNGGR